MSSSQSSRYWSRYIRLIRVHTNSLSPILVKKIRISSLRLLDRLINSSKESKFAERRSTIMKQQRRYSQLARDLKEETEEEIIFGGKENIFS